MIGRDVTQRSPNLPLGIILGGIVLVAFVVASGCSSPDDSPSKTLANYQPPAPEPAASARTIVQGQSAPANPATAADDGFAGLPPGTKNGSLDGTIWQSGCVKGKRVNNRDSYRHTRLQFDLGRIKLTHSAWDNDRTCANDSRRMATIELIGNASLTFEDQGLPDSSGAIRARLEVTQHELFLSFDHESLVARSNQDAVCGITSWQFRTFLSIDGRTCRLDFVNAFTYQRDQVFAHGTVYTSREIIWPTPTQTVEPVTGQVDQHDQLQISPFVVDSLKSRQAGRTGLPQKAVSGTLTVYRSTPVPGTGEVTENDGTTQPLQIIDPGKDPFEP